MKIEFTTRGKDFEIANFILAEGIRSLEDAPETRKRLLLSDYDLKRAIRFREQLTKGFLRAIK